MYHACLMTGARERAVTAADVDEEGGEQEQGKNRKTHGLGQRHRIVQRIKTIKIGTESSVSLASVQGV